MNVFIIGTSLETAKALDKKRLNRQIQEAQVMLDAIEGKKAWSNHPCTLQYQNHADWLYWYKECLKSFRDGDLKDAERRSIIAYSLTPSFHTEKFLNQMKRRLYTKDKLFYKQWAYLGESEDNWYFVDGIMRVYNNGKRLK